MVTEVTDDTADLESQIPIGERCVGKAGSERFSGVQAGKGG